MAAEGSASRSAELPRIPPHPGHSFTDFHISGNARVSLGNKHYEYSTNYFHGPAPQTPPSDVEICKKALILTDPKVDRELIIDSKGQRVAGTCRWILENEKFKSWRDADSGLLWLSGGPGKGKTFISIFLAQEFERLAQKTSNAISLEYYCDNKNDKRNTALCILRGLIFQILEQRPKTVSYILQPFKTQEGGLFGNDSSFATLVGIFRRMLADSSISHVYLVVDALDECAVGVENFIKRLKTLVTSEDSELSTTRLQIIVVGREYPKSIPRALGSCARIRLDPDSDEQINEDLKLYIATKVDEYFPRYSYSDDWPERLKSDLLRRANGTFLWVGFAMEILEKQCHSRIEVNDALSSLPGNLDSMYKRMLTDIRHDHRENAAAILRWVVMALRPLTIPEISKALGIAADRQAGLNSAQVTRDHVSFCGNLLTTNQWGEVTLVHQSAKDYLLSNDSTLPPDLEMFRIHAIKVHSEIAKKCLHYLDYDELSRYELDVRHSVDADRPTSYIELGGSAFFTYAVIFWPEHLRNLSDQTEAKMYLSMPMFERDTRLRAAWMRVYLNRAFDSRVALRPPDDITPLHLASYLGIKFLVQELVSQTHLLFAEPANVLVNQQDSLGGTPLSYSAANGYKAIVQVLLDSVEEVDLNQPQMRKSLGLAATREDGVFQLLLQKVSHVTMRDSCIKQAFMDAAFSGKVVAMKQLLEATEDFTEINGWKQAALEIAASQRHDAVVELLQEKGTDINCVDEQGETLLDRTLRQRSPNDVEYLLLKGAEINFTKCNLSAVLEDKCIRGSPAMIQQVLKKTDFKISASFVGAALDFAARHGNVDIVRLVLKRADKDEWGREDLKWPLLFAKSRAKTNDQIEVVHLLAPAVAKWLR